MISRLSRASKSLYYCSYFENNFYNMKQTWKCINSLISNKKTISKTVTIIKNPNSSSTTSEPTEVTNVLNKHFATVGQNLSSKFKLNK